MHDLRIGKQKGRGAKAPGPSVSKTHFCDYARRVAGKRDGVKEYIP